MINEIVTDCWNLKDNIVMDNELFVMNTLHNTILVFNKQTFLINRRIMLSTVVKLHTIALYDNKIYISGETNKKQCIYTYKRFYDDKILN
jgi:hypothetical protein